MDRYICGEMCFFGPNAYSLAVAHYRNTSSGGISRIDSCRIDEGDGIRATIIHGEKVVMPFWVSRADNPVGDGD